MDQSTRTLIAYALIALLLLAGVALVWSRTRDERRCRAAWSRPRGSRWAARLRPLFHASPVAPAQTSPAEPAPIDRRIS